MSECGVCGWPGRHFHFCARCGRRLTVGASDWRVSQPVRPNGTLGELIVEHFECDGSEGRGHPPASSGDTRASRPPTFREKSRAIGGPERKNESGVV